MIKTTNSVQQERLGLSVFPLAATVNQEAFYLQPDSWVDDKTGDLIKKENTQREYLNYPHPFDLDTGEELTGYTHINDSINTKASREIGVCCLQSKQVASPGQYNVWTDSKRIQIDTPAGPRVVQTTDPATWDDTKYWVEGWDKNTDTHMVQVKRHPQLTNKTLKIDCYMKILTICTQGWTPVLSRMKTALMAILGHGISKGATRPTLRSKSHKHKSRRGNHERRTKQIL